MRTIIAGSRIATDPRLITIAMNHCGWVPTVVISGTASGADTLGENWAEEHDIPVERYPAQWSMYGKSAGYRRNADMANKAEALVALWDGSSRGTKHMIDLAKRKGLEVYVLMFESRVINPCTPEAHRIFRVIN